MVLDFSLNLRICNEHANSNLSKIQEHQTGNFFFQKKPKEF